MNINLPPEQEAFIDQLVSCGQFASPDEAISESIRLLVARERLREQVQIGIEQADRDDVVSHDTVFAQLRAMATVAGDRDISRL
jgi:putative addiction module CopG family antidote